MSTEANKAVSRRFHQLFDAGDIEGIGREVLDLSVVVHFPGSPGPVNHDGFKQLGQMFQAAFPDHQTTIEDQIAEGDLVVTRTMFRGTHQGELQGIPPTGKPVAVSGITIDRIAGGKIVERWDEFDQVGMLQQIGAIPMPA
ncbi:MAG TPA: ester cyclase [Anaerolineae bacterium]|nr:ester cyclase [Anaerolineae bacterium]